MACFNTTLSCCTATIHTGCYAIQLRPAGHYRNTGSVWAGGRGRWLGFDLWSRPQQLVCPRSGHRANQAPTAMRPMHAVPGLRQRGRQPSFAVKPVSCMRPPPPFVANTTKVNNRA
jgi:hypothetical protein